MNRAILPTSALLTASTISLANVSVNGRLPGSREWLGMGIAFFMLAAVSDLGAPQVANGMAWLVLLTVLITRGPEAFEFLIGKTQKPKTKKPTSVKKGQEGTLV